MVVCALIKNVQYGLPIGNIYGDEKSVTFCYSGEQEWRGINHLLKFPPGYPVIQKFLCHSEKRSDEESCFY